MRARLALLASGGLLVSWFQAEGHTLAPMREASRFPGSSANLLLALMGLMIGFIAPGHCQERPASATDTAALTALPTWTPTGTLSTPRHGHAATLLPNGKVLVFGGVGDAFSYLESAELYDIASGTWSFTGPGGPWEHQTALLLPNGKVLAVGYYDIQTGDGLYDPATGTWSFDYYSSYPDAATLLLDGKVLIVELNATFTSPLAKLYDPATDTSLSVATPTSIHQGSTATLLQDGRVLVAGGWGIAEVYNPVSDSWEQVGPLVIGGDTATLLLNGKVLMVGGAVGAVAKLYDPAAETFTDTGSLNTPRGGHTATLLPNGKVLVAGGDTESGATRSVELYDPDTGVWTRTSSLNTARFDHTATLLPDGRVLVAGGHCPLSSAEIYDPAGNPANQPPFVEACAQEVIVDNLPPGFRGISGCGEVDFSGPWSTSAVGGAYGNNSSLDSGSSSASHIWRTPVFSSTQSCTYDVYAWWTASGTRSTSVPITVSGHTGSSATALFNQRLDGSRWNLHGRYSFAAGARGSVQTSGANGLASADAVRFVLAGPTVAFSFSPAAKSIGEGAGAVSFILERSSGAAAQTVYLSTTTTEGFANNNDYSGLSSVPYAFAAGETSKTVTINLVNDTAVEPDETFGLIAQQNIGDPLTTYLAKASFTITNDDTAAAGCAAEIIVDNLGPGGRGVSGTGEVDFRGKWSTSAVGGAYGVNGSLNSSGSSAWYTWRTPVFSSTRSCTYDVYAWWTASSNRSTTVPITVSGHTGSPVTSLFNQRLNGGKWNLHGRYSFAAGGRGSVQTSGANGRAIADAVRFVLAPAQ